MKDAASAAGVGVAVLEAETGHALAQAALFKKLLLQAEELLVDQVVGFTPLPS